MLQKRLFWNGLHIKWTGDAGMFVPPFITERVKSMKCALLSAKRWKTSRTEDDGPL
jgi:hypothetical protein